MRIGSLFTALLVAVVPLRAQNAALSGSWRAALDLAGGPLPFELRVAPEGDTLAARICNGPSCADRATVVVRGDSVVSG